MAWATMRKEILSKGRPVWFVGVSGEGSNSFYNLTEAKHEYERIQKALKTKGTYDLDARRRG